IGQNSYKLFSFELKISLNFSNLKESYFQAVSNSSWANEGYLVVFEEIDEEVLSELRRLNQSFGIGVIKLECETLDSKILLSSREREIDIQTLNMLLEKNSDFKIFIEDINKQIKAGFDTEIKAKFDKVFDDEEMQKYIEEKLIIEQ
ncbi:MAG: HrgA protein, partial [Helicobacter sp.]|nr:HrgA protein [Helicobacter sp.]